MIAYITSVGEPTTDLCSWSLKRQGFEVVVVDGATTLWEKLRLIFTDARDDFIRVDADVVVNQNIRGVILQDLAWWYQTYTFDWFKQDITHGGIQFVRQPAIAPALKHIDEAREKNRPESYLYRLAEFHEPRRCETWPTICGLHGYKQDGHLPRVMETKRERDYFVSYDFELAAALEAL